MKSSHIAAGLFLNLSLLLGAAATGHPQEPKAPQKPKQEEPAKAATPTAAAPVPADEVFVEIYENYQWVLHEIDRIERAQGTTEIPISIRDLRVRAQAKLARLKEWMGEHKVPETWNYNSDAHVFVAPPGNAEVKK